MTTSTKRAAITSASFWIGARVRCASPTMCTMRASSVSEPTRSARMMTDPLPLTVAPMTLSPAAFATGTGSPVIIDSSMRRRAFQHRAVDGDLLARLHAQAIADDDAFERHLFFACRRRALATPDSATSRSSALIASLVRPIARS